MRKIILSVGIVILITVGLMVYKLVAIKGEFEDYLKVTYPNVAFQVEFPKIDIAYGSFYSDVFCIEDSTSFDIAKSWSSNNISEQYLIIKKLESMNSKMAEMFSGTIVEKYIDNMSVSAGKTPTIEKDTYGEMYITIKPDCDMGSVTKDVFKVLKEKNIVVENIKFTYEVNLSVYEGHFSSKDYDLTEEDIENRIVKIK